LRIARKKRWNIQEEKRIQQEIELQTLLNRLILEDRDRKTAELRKTGEDVDIQVSILPNTIFSHFKHICKIFSQISMSPWSSG
jgi:STIP1 family protein 1